jgi:hypothetical protein
MISGYAAAAAGDGDDFATFHVVEDAEEVGFGFGGLDDFGGVSCGHWWASGL